MNYGDRMRAVADYLETVPDDKYDFAMYRDPDDPECGCIAHHGHRAEIIPANFNYAEDVQWLIGSHQNWQEMLYAEQASVRDGREARLAAIRALRAYANKHYPLKTKPLLTGIPKSVLDLFKETANEAI